MTVAGCGKSSGTATTPTNTTTTQNNCFAVVGNKGTVTASVTGLSAYTGTIPAGGSTYLQGGTGPLLSLTSTSVQDGSSVEIVGEATVGTHAVGSSTINTPSVGNTITVITRSCQAGTGTCVANIAFGSGTITVTSASSAAASGSFSATLLPGPGAVGQKTIVGQFSVTF